MCRIFGFRSVIQSQVHTSLVHAENALGLQSNAHPDGWGVAYYIGGSPHLIKSEKTAMDDSIFQRVSGIVSSQTVLAHIRNATLGQVNILNTHPFQFGPWVFAHNGNVKDFANYRDKIVSMITPNLRRFILGNTDSEVIFYFLLSHLEGKINLFEKSFNIDVVAKSLQESITELVKIIGPYSQIDNAGNTETYLTFILTNGETMIAHHGGKNLHYSTYKTRCPERDTCPSFAPECEAVTKSGYVNHLIFSSEPLSGENIWIPMHPGQLIGIDHDMKLRIY